MEVSQASLEKSIRDAVNARCALEFSTGQARQIPLPSAVLSPLRDLLDDRLPSQLAGDPDEPAAKTLEFLHHCAITQDQSGPTVSVSASVIRKIVRETMCATDGTTGRGPESKVLYLRNLAIDGDLDLSGLVIDGSIKLVCCAVKGSIRLVHTVLQSCEFSGSICNTFEASYVTIAGSLRARRSMFLGVIDLGAAKIGGVLDLMDCLAVPLHMPNSSGVRVPQRGILNLALARIDHDIRLNRAQIMGHVMMNGASIGNCIFADQLFVSSISNTVRIAEICHIVVKSGRSFTNLSNILSGSTTPYDQAIANNGWVQYTLRTDAETLAIIHRRTPAASAANSTWTKDWINKVFEFRSLRLHTSIKKLSLAKGPSAEHPFLNLLRRNSQSTQCEAISAIGIRVGGAINGRGSTFLGSIVFEHARIEGGVSLEGLTVDGNPKEPETLDDNRVIPSTLSFSHIEIKGGDLKIKGPTSDEEVSPPISMHNKCFAEIDLSNSIIGGTVSISNLEFADISAEHLDSSENQEKTTLIMSYSQIGGGVSIMDTKNLAGIKAPGITTVGSFKMMKLAKFDRDLDKYDDFELRHENATGTIGLSDASIGRDLVLIFNRDKGPSLDLTGIKVASRLAILPAFIPDIAALTDEAKELEACRPASRSRYLDWLIWRLRTSATAWTHDKLFRGTTQAPAELDCEHVTQALLRLIAAEERIIRQGVEARMRGRNWPTDPIACGAAERLLLRWFGGDNKKLKNPRIQLRQATAGMLVHPPTAWPRFGEIRLEGFQYSLVDSMGPLAPIRRRLKSHAKATSGSRRIMYLPRIITASICLYLLCSHLNWLPEWLDSALLTELYNVIGRTVTTSLALMLTLSLTWLFSHSLFPPSNMATPLAIHWLKLQGGRPSVYRNIGWFGSLGSYLQAARVLRTAGRRNSAAETEYARLRLRERMLSWRNHWPVKLLGRTVDTLSGYGFRPARAIVIFIVLLMGGGATANQIYACGGATPQLIDTWSPDPVLSGEVLPSPKPDAGTASSPFDATSTLNAVPAAAPGEAAAIVASGSLKSAESELAKLPRDERRFSGLAYALDRYVPGYDGGELQRWSLGNRWVDISNEAYCLHGNNRLEKFDPGADGTNYAQAARARLVSLSVQSPKEYLKTVQERNNFLSMLNRILEYIGITLIGFIAIMAVSVTARVESLLTRPEES